MENPPYDYEQPEDKTGHCQRCCYLLCDRDEAPCLNCDGENFVEREEE